MSEFVKVKVKIPINILTDDVARRATGVDVPLTSGHVRREAAANERLQNVMSSETQ